MGAMTPLVVSLVFQGLKLAAQAATGSLRARAALSELEFFMIQLAQEQRDPTPDEFALWTGRTASLDSEFKGQLDELRSILEARTPSS